MSVEAQDSLFEDALSLPVEARARLVERLLESLNPPTRDDVDRRWAEEAERRVEELRSGQTQPIPGDQVFDEIFARYGR